MTAQDAFGARRPHTEREIALAKECIAAARAALDSLMPDFADRLNSSSEASGVSMLISRRMLDDEIPGYIGEIAKGLAHEAHELRWPNWRDAIALPPARICPSCETKMPGGFKRSWQWCPACGNSLADPDEA